MGDLIETGTHRSTNIKLKVECPSASKIKHLFKIISNGFSDSLLSKKSVIKSLNMPCGGKFVTKMKFS